VYYTKPVLIELTQAIS